MVEDMIKLKDRAIGCLRSEAGTILATVAVIAFFVALAALATLALSVSQIESIDDETNRIQAVTVAEAGMEEALYGLKYNDVNKMPNKIEGIRNLTPQQLSQILRNTSEVNKIPYADDPERSYSAAVDEVNIDASADPNYKTLSGDSSKNDITYIDDSTLVRNLAEFDYQKLNQNQENWVFSLGEARKTEANARSAISAKIYDESSTMFQRREVQTWNYNENKPDAPAIESEHKSYDAGQIRSWVVSYPTDPSHPNRHLMGIDLLIKGENLGLGSAGDTIAFSAWNGSSFDPPFEAVCGPITEGGAGVRTSCPVKTSTIRVVMKSDSIDDTTNTTANYGFKISGVEYHYDFDRLPAYFETPHPYDGIETNISYLYQPEFVQVVYSPYALPKNKVNPIKNQGPDIISTDNMSPTGEAPSGTGLNSFQVMRLHFDEFFYLEDGDILKVYNANNGSLMATYTGSSGANLYTPYAYRTNSDFPLAIALVFKRDGDNSMSVKNYGYKVDRVEYTDEEGNFTVLDNPVQTTSHSDNVGYNDGLGGEMRRTTIFKPADPILSGTVTGWKVVFGTNADLVAVVGDSDRVILKLSPIGGVAYPDQYFVSPTGIYGVLIGTPNYHKIDDLKNLSVDMEMREWLEVLTEFDNQNSFASLNDNYGWSIDRLDVAYDNAVADDETPPGVRSSAITLRSIDGKTATSETMVYPAYGSNSDTRGEWWINAKNKKQVLLHFDLDSFRVESGDRVEIYDENGNLIELLVPEGDGTIYNPGGPYGGGEGGGPILTDLTPNPPAGLIDTKGWVIVPSESARIILRGDGSSNVGYSGFDIDRVAFWSATASLRNPITDFGTEDTGDYSKDVSNPIKKFLQY